MKGSGLPSGKVSMMSQEGSASMVSQEGSAAAKGAGGAGKVRGVSEVSAGIPSRRVIVGHGQTTFTPLGGGRGSPTARTASPGVGRGRAVTVELPSMGSPGGLQEASPDLPEAFDSHLHWDRAVPKFGTGRADFGHFLRVGLSHQPQTPFELVGGVVVYCDPKTWPAVPVRLEAGWVAAVGLHPKKALQLRDAEAEQLTKLSGHPSVTALGEVGLDLSEGTGGKLAQMESLGWMLSLAYARVPIILHLRGAPVDPTGDEIHELALGIMEKREVSPQRRVHLHSFTGGPDLVDKWESRYPNVFFGLSLAVRGFSAKQKVGVKAIPPNKLLLESDSHYFPPPGTRHGHPQYLYEVAALVGEIRGCSPEEVLGQSVRNGCRLYGVRR